MKRNEKDPLDRYRAFGIAATLPGLQYAAEVIQGALDELRAQLAAMQNGDAPKKQRRISPDGIAAIQAAQKRRWAKASGDDKRKGGAGVKAFWANMTPEQRSAEMRRRMGKREVTEVKLHPRDAAHPDHDDWLAKTKKAARKRWANMTPKQQKARLAKMAAGRVNGAAVPAVRMEAK